MDNEEHVLNDTSILNDVKKILGIDETNPDFDVDLVMAINTTLMALNQMGFGQSNFYITGESEKWSDLLLEDEVNLHAIKTWVAFRTRMIFDPPTSNLISDAIKAAISEAEFRIYINKNYVGEINELYK